MQTTEFLSLVLPPEGPYHLRWMVADKKDSPVKGQSYVNSIDELTTLAKQIDSQGHPIYYGTASYIDGSVGVSASGKNVAYKNAYYIDIDIGEGKDYPTRPEGAAALTKAIIDLSLPPPLIVSSGNGFHVYWPLAERVPVETWRTTAVAFKKKLRAYGLRSDTTVTADRARILRIPGTHHRKDGVKEVKVLRTGAVVTQEQFANMLDIIPDPVGDDVSDLFGVNTDLADSEYPDSDPDAVAEKCAFVRAFKETGFAGGGAQSEWYYALGTVSFCKPNGVEKCHEWSAQDENYTESKCQDEIDRWRETVSGPATCEQLSDFEHCEGCEHRGQITTPVRLGYARAEQERVKAQGAEVSGEWWPKNVGYVDDEGMYIKKFNAEEGTWDKVFFTASKFYVETRIWSDDGSWSFRVHRLKYVVNGVEQWESFTVPTQDVARPVDLAKAFAKQEVYMSGAKGANLLSEVLKQYGDELRLRQVETAMHTVMGWHAKESELDISDIAYPAQADGFIIGNKLITADEEKEVLLADNVPHELRNGLGLRGAASTWAREVNDMFVNRDRDMYLFVILASFASPLVSLFGRDEYRGNPISLVGVSGWGKSTIAKIAMSIWGDPRLLFANGNPASGATTLSFQNKISALRHVGLLLDEVTLQLPAVLAELIYTIAMGEPRKRLGVDGKPRPSPAPWSSISFITSNKPVLQMITEDATTTEDAGDAIQKRVFEVNFDNLGYEKDKITDDPEFSTRMQRLFSENYGHIGRVWVRYIIEHKAEIIGDLIAQNDVCKKMTPDHASERFHDYFEAAVMTACIHIGKAGILQVQKEDIRKFIRSIRTDMAAVRNDSRLPVLDSFARYLAQHQNGMLVTDYMPMGRGRPKKKEFPQKELRGEMVGRIAIKDHIALIAIAPFKEWCNQRSLDFNKMLKELDINGYFSHDAQLIKGNNGKIEPLKTAIRRVDLGRGTALVSSRANVLAMDFGRICNETKLHSVNAECDADGGVADAND